MLTRTDCQNPGRQELLALSAFSLSPSHCSCRCANHSCLIEVHKQQMGFILAFEQGKHWSGNPTGVAPILPASCRYFSCWCLLHWHFCLVSYEKLLIAHLSILRSEGLFSFSWFSASAASLALEANPSREIRSPSSFVNGRIHLQSQLLQPNLQSAISRIRFLHYMSNVPSPQTPWHRTQVVP